MVERFQRHPLQRLAHRRRPHVAVVGNPPVQFAQERPPVQVVIFPRVFAVQDDRRQRVAPRAQDAGAVLADAPQKIVRRRARIHLRIHETDQVAQEVVAEDRTGDGFPPCRQRYGR